MLSPRPCPGSRSPRPCPRPGGTMPASRAPGWCSWTDSATTASAPTAATPAPRSRRRSAASPPTGSWACTSTAAWSCPTPTTPALAELNPAERARLDGVRDLVREGTGYADLQSTKPQTLAYALNDSPVGQLAWIADKFKDWTDPAADLPEHAVDIDQLLTNVTLYWLTGTGGSSAHQYRAVRDEAGPGPVRGADRCRGLPDRPGRAPAPRTRAPDRALVRVRPRRPLRLDGGARPPRPRPPRLLPPAARPSGDVRACHPLARSHLWRAHVQDLAR